MSVTVDTKLPLEDGQTFEDAQGRSNLVVGPIRYDVPEDPVCYTRQGRWYRRRDGVEMTGGSGRVTTIPEFYAWKANRMTPND